MDAAPPEQPAAAPEATPAPRKKRKHRWLRRIGFFVLLLIVLGCIARPFLPYAVRWYVNRTLDRSEIYRGKIGDIDIHLWRGAYSIHDIRLNKITGNVPVPLFSSPRVDFAVQWDALVHGKVVGQFVTFHPELNFVAAQNNADSQSGAGGPWLQIIRDLFPFKINSARVIDGSIHFRTYQTPTPVDVYLDHLDASVDNLTNIHDDVAPLITTVHATALAMDQAKFEYEMKLDPFSYRPTFHMAMRLLGLDVTTINQLALAYGDFDFKGGFFDLVVEADAKEGLITGYVKPLFRHLRLFALKQDIKQDNVLEFFWQALLGVTTEIFENQPRDQFGTLIPFTVDTSGTKPDILATVGNILRNAFVRAYLPKLQNGTNATEGMQFSAPDLSAPISVGEQQ